MADYDPSAFGEDKVRIGASSISRNCKGASPGAEIRGTKTRKARLVPVHPDLRAWIEAHVDRRGRLVRAPLFVNPATGKRCGEEALRRNWAGACRRTGVRSVRMYEGLKHSFATIALGDGHTEGRGTAPSRKWPCAVGSTTWGRSTAPFEDGQARPLAAIGQSRIEGRHTCLGVVEPPQWEVTCPEAPRHSRYSGGGTLTKRIAERELGFGFGGVGVGVGELIADISRRCEGVPVGPSGADLFVCESYFYDKRVPFHLDYSTLMEQHRSELDCKRLVLTHMSSDMLSRLPDLPVEAAHDGLTLVL